MAKADKEKQKNEPKVKLSDLFYYFDSQERNRLDQGRLGRKSGQVLALREKLLCLPEPEFDVAIRTIEQIVGSRDIGSETSEVRRNTAGRREAIELFERTNTAIKLTPASDKISRV